MPCISRRKTKMRVRILTFRSMPLSLRPFLPPPAVLSVALGILGPCLSGLCPRRAEAQKPVARFQWRMVEHFGPRNAAGTMIDFHWHPDSVLPKYDPSYVNPPYWKVEVNACQAGNGGGTFYYTWTTGGPPAQQMGPSPECVDTLRFHALGPYLVKLAVTSPSGLRDSVRDTVVVKDWLIVSIGDSYASGEGNPDIPQRFDHSGLTVTSGPKWEDRRCHRSEFSGPAQAALAIERADSLTSVTFLSFACSGAQIDTGLTGGYAGAGGEHAAPWLLSQVDQADSAVKERPIDVLLIQIGVNDIGFDAILSKCRGIDSYANDPMQYLNPLTAAAALLS